MRYPVMFLGIFVSIFSAIHAQSDQRAGFPYSNKVSLVAGLIQYASGGGNLELNYHTRYLAFDYSHGWNLQFTQPGTLSQAQQDQQIHVSIPWTTGFGVGYRLTPNLDVRLEPKWHRYEIFYNDVELAGDPITAYTTATLGVGFYYRIWPFRKKDNALNGIVIVPNARFWPNIWSSLEGDEFTYQNRLTGQTETHSAAQQGIPGTGGFFVNMSIGYTFGGR